MFYVTYIYFSYLSFGTMSRFRENWWICIRA